MKNIGFFINSTIDKKKLDINHHNINTLFMNFNEIHVCDEKNKHAEELKKKNKKINNINYNFTNDFNLFQKINILFKTINDYSDINQITIILDDYIYLNNLKNYFDFVNQCSYDLISFTDSTEFFYHFQIYILTIKKNEIETFKKIINDFSLKKNDFNIIYLDFLKELVKQIKNKTAFCKTAYIESVEKKNIYLSDSEYYYYLLSREILPIIKIKFLNNLVRDYDNKEFVHKKIPIDFNIDIYRNYEDLKNYDDSFLMKHFLEHGQYECRKYKKSENILPNVLWEKLNKIKLVQYFDFPENFDFYSYKDKNPDLKKLNKLELKKHWINYGAFEDRLY